jgi:hypothetical protein
MYQREEKKPERKGGGVWGGEGGHCTVHPCQDKACMQSVFAAQLALDDVIVWIDVQ